MISKALFNYQIKMRVLVHFLPVIYLFRVLLYGRSIKINHCIYFNELRECSQLTSTKMAKICCSSV